MAIATLTSHNRGDRYVDLQELPRVAPAPIGPRHRPLAHRAVADVLLGKLDEKGMRLTSDKWALGNQDARMFGVMTIAPKTEDVRTLTSYPEEMTAAIGIRHANDMSIALKLVAGMEVFVCSNLAMYGQGDGAQSLRKLHTAGLNLEAEIDAALERTFERFHDVNETIKRFKEYEVTDSQAKTIIYDAFTSKESPVPNRLFPLVHGWYFMKPFDPTVRETLPHYDDLSDVQPRTLYGISSAFTRAIREQPIGRQIGASMKVMKVLAKVSR
jgi:hypothetical protein